MLGTIKVSSFSPDSNFSSYQNFCRLSFKCKNFFESPSILTT